MMRRFSDTRMKDPCTRICRDPIRKLSNNERFISPAAAALKHGINPVNIIKGIMLALRYDYADDDQAVRLGDMLKYEGINTVLEKVCSLSKDCELYNKILEEWKV